MSSAECSMSVFVDRSFDEDVNTGIDLFNLEYSFHIIRLFVQSLPVRFKFSGKEQTEGYYKT